MNSANEIISKLQEQKEYLYNNYKVQEIAIFGSYARGEQKKKSDIDILVDINQNYHTFRNYMSLKFYLEDLFNKRIDLILKESMKKNLNEIISKDLIYA